MSKKTSERDRGLQPIISVPIFNSARGADLPYSVISISPSAPAGMILRDCDVPQSVIRGLNIRLVPGPSMKVLSMAISDAKRGISGIFLHTDLLWDIHQRAECVATEMLDGVRSSFPSGLFPPSAVQDLEGHLASGRTDPAELIGLAGDLAVNHQVARVLGREGQRYKDLVDHPFLVRGSWALANVGLPLLCMDLVSRFPIQSGNEGYDLFFNSIRVLGAFIIGTRLSALDPFNLRATFAGDRAFHRPKPQRVLQLRQNVDVEQV